MARLTPSDCADPLLADVIWVKQGRIEHMSFIDLMRNYGAEAVCLR
jgi:arginine deiminase